MRLTQSVKAAVANAPFFTCFELSTLEGGTRFVDFSFYERKTEFFFRREKSDLTTKVDRSTSLHVRIVSHGIGEQFCLGPSRLTKESDLKHGILVEQKRKNEKTRRKCYGNKNAKADVTGSRSIFRKTTKRKRFQGFSIFEERYACELSFRVYFYIAPPPIARVIAPFRAFAVFINCFIEQAKF
jgi:hypothetical protein